MGKNTVDSVERLSDTESGPPLTASSGPYPFNRGRHLLAAAMWAYGDESGIFGSADWCILAGFVGNPKQWTRFKRGWSKALRKFGDGSIPEFKSSDFFPPERRKHVEHYADWTDEKAEAYLRALLRVINETDVRPIGVAMNVPDFVASGYWQRRFITGGLVKSRTMLRPDGSGRISLSFDSSGAPNQPYLAVIQRFIVNVLLLTPGGAKAHITLDRQKTLEKRADETFREQFAKGRTGRPDLEAKVGQLAYADSEDEAGLQAADLCAYMWQRVLTGKANGRLQRMAAEHLHANGATLNVYRRKHLDDMFSKLLDDSVEGFRLIRDGHEWGQQ